MSLLAVTFGFSPLGVEGSVAATAAADLSAFRSCSEFTQYMRTQAEKEVGAYGFGGGPMLYKGAPAQTMNDSRGGAPTPVAAPQEAVGNNATGTNVQERGVDEPDVAKVDGSKLLTLVDGKLVMVETKGKKPKKLDALGFPEGQYPTELFVLPGNRALVIGSAWEQEAQPRADEAPAGRRFAPGGYYGGGTSLVAVTLVDTSGSSLKPLRSARVTGSYVSARLSDGVVRIVFGSRPRIHFAARSEGEPDAVAETRNRATVRQAKAEAFLPERQIFDAAGKAVSKVPLLGCTSVRRPDRPSGLGMLSVMNLDTENGSKMFERGEGIGIVANGDVVYSSTRRLYVATTEGGWGWNRPWAGPRRQATDQRVTAIHAFDATTRTISDYLGSGTVPGYVLGRWAFSEDRGYLRVATTTGEPWAPQEDGQVSESRVTVLDETRDGLKKVGSVTGLGKTERIRGIRWFGDLAAIVTFRQTDPLYMVDLSNPAKPRVRGELKIPGYSAYLHPTGGGGLLGIGQDADSDGRVTGLLAQQFDVSNVAKPTRTDKLGLGKGYTTVEHDSRAFTYLTGRRLAVIPAWVNQKVSCPPNAQCAAGGPDQPGFVGEISVPAAIGVLVGADGSLSRAGKFIGDSTIVRVVPVGDRLAAITATSVFLLDPKGLKQVGSVRTSSAPKQ
ncbi:MAG: beta-propeller domain-containing protein [Sporichthyaceae bacterium]